MADPLQETRVQMQTGPQHIDVHIRVAAHIQFSNNAEVINKETWDERQPRPKANFSNYSNCLVALFSDWRGRHIRRDGNRLRFHKSSPFHLSPGFVVAPLYPVKRGPYR